MSRKKNSNLETTIVSVRMSNSAKTKLNDLASDLKLLNQKDPNEGIPKADMTTLIKIAIMHTWDIDCDEQDTTMTDTPKFDLRIYCRK